MSGVEELLMNWAPLPLSLLCGLFSCYTARDSKIKF